MIIDKLQVLTLRFCIWVGTILTSVLPVLMASICYPQIYYYLFGWGSSPGMILIPLWYCRDGRALTSVEIILRYSMLGVWLDGRTLWREHSFFYSREDTLRLLCLLWFGPCGMLLADGLLNGIKPHSLCSLHPIPFNLPNMYCHMQSWTSPERRYLLTFLLILVRYNCLLFFVFSLWLPIDIIRLNLCLMISPALFLRCVSLKPYNISCSLKLNWENLGASNDCSHLIASCGST